MISKFYNSDRTSILQSKENQIKENRCFKTPKRKGIQMGNQTIDFGKVIYSEKRNIRKEKIHYTMIGFGIMVFIGLILYVSTLHSSSLTLLSLVLFVPLLYPAILSIIIGTTGIRILKVCENGLILPHSSDIRRNITKQGFIDWHEVHMIFQNKNLRVSKLFPYLVIKLKDQTLTIPNDTIINFGVFINAIEPYCNVVKTTEFRNGLFPIEYHPPSNEARLDDEAIIIGSSDKEISIPFADIKSVVIKMNYQLRMKDGKRIGLLGMSREDVERIKREFSKSSKGGITNKSGTSMGGVLKSSIESDE